MWGVWLRWGVGHRLLLFLGLWSFFIRVLLAIPSLLNNDMHLTPMIVFHQRLIPLLLPYLLLHWYVDLFRELSVYRLEFVFTSFQHVSMDSLKGVIKVFEGHHHCCYVI